MNRFAPSMLSTPICLCLAALTAFACLALPGPCKAAPLAQEHTVLYYLVEMQRRVNRNCQGRPMPEAPSLLPSEALRTMAMESLDSGRSAESLAAASGLEGTPLVVLFGTGDTGRQVFDRLMAGQCPDLMGADYHYIGAAGSGGRWTVILAAAEKGRAPAPDAGKAATAASFGPQAAQPQSAPDPGTQRDRQKNGQKNAKAASGWIDGGEVRYPADRQAEAAPAPSVPVGEMRLDAAGRPVGPLHPLEASVSEAFPGDSADFADGGHGFAGDRADFGPGPGEAFASPGQAPSAMAEADSAAPGAAPDATPGAAPGVMVPDGFVPPSAPGPFGVAAPPAVDGPRPGVVPLTDNRPQAPDENLVYTAPPGKADGAAGLNGAYGADGADGTSGTSDGSAAGGAYGAYGPGAYSGQPEHAPLPESPRSAGTYPVRPQGVGPGAQGAGGSPDALLALVNAERALGGTCGGVPMPPSAPLTLSLVLSDAASAHAADMAARGYFSSKAPGGPDLGRRVGNAGYVWSLVAENLAAGQSTPQGAVMSWLSDAGQCKNLLDSEFTEAGIGRDPAGRYWVLTVAAPALLDEGGLRLERQAP